MGVTGVGAAASPPVTSGPGTGDVVEFDLVQRFGTRIVEMPGLERTLIYVPNHDIAIIRAGLDPGSARQAANWLLVEALRQRTSPAP